MSYDQTRVDEMVHTYKSNLQYDRTPGISNFEYESRLNRIVNFCFDRRTPVVRFRENNIEFYSGISSAPNEILEWRYEAILDSNLNTRIIVTVLKTANEPMKIVNEIIEQDLNLFNYLD